MTNSDSSFLNVSELQLALDLLRNRQCPVKDLPDSLPIHGSAETTTLSWLAPHVLGKAARLDASTSLAHMDPPTPWITWAMALWNARLNQNLLHPATAPFALEAEQRVIDWLSPLFGMNGGHLCSGSTVANLTALWAAREVAGINRVVASSAAHLSVKKAAHILGLTFDTIETDAHGRLDATQLDDLTGACLVLTAGTTTTGAIDPLDLAGQFAWTHVDAAWAGPLRLSDQHTALLDGIDSADSVALSAHKWLFQPKDSALILFRNTETAHESVSFGGSYLATPNVGVQGSRGAAAIPLLATLLAWGKTGFAERIDRLMAMAQKLADAMDNDDRFELWNRPETGVTVFRPLTMATEALLAKLPEGMLSTCQLDDKTWLRSVAANPLVDIEVIVATLKGAVV